MTIERFYGKEAHNLIGPYAILVAGLSPNIQFLISFQNHRFASLSNLKISKAEKLFIKTIYKDDG